MTTTKSPQRFWINPLEILIFLAVIGIFAHSVYRLFYAAGDFQANALTPMSANPLSDGRGLAQQSAAKSFQNFDVRCEGTSDAETPAQKVRLAGPLCGMENSGGPGQLLKATVQNNANKYSATVFLDTSGGRFSTDYIPLNTGRNPIQLEFTYGGGKIVSQQVNLSRN